MTKRAPPAKGEKGYDRLAFDNYRTPGWVTQTLIDHIKHRIGGPVWEPAAGEGDMVAVLRAAKLDTFASDIRSTGTDWDGLDFLSPPDWDVMEQHMTRKFLFPAAIITNPPYAHAEQFIVQALRVTEAAKGIVAMLLLHEFDAPAYHKSLMQHEAFAMKLMLPHRIRWVGFENRASPRQVHSWYLWAWDKPRNHAPAMVWA